MKLKHTLKQFPRSVQLRSSMKSQLGEKGCHSCGMYLGKPRSSVSLGSFCTWRVPHLSLHLEHGIWLLLEPRLYSGRERKNKPCLQGAADTRPSCLTCRKAWWYDKVFLKFIAKQKNILSHFTFSDEMTPYLTQFLCSRMFEPSRLSCDILHLIQTCWIKLTRTKCNDLNESWVPNSREVFLYTIVLLMCHGVLAVFCLFCCCCLRSS